MIATCSTSTLFVRNISSQGTGIFRQMKKLNKENVIRRTKTMTNVSDRELLELIAAQVGSLTTQVDSLA